MSSPVRLVVGLLAITTVLVLLNVLLLRRVSAAFGLSRRARRALGAGLAVPLAGTILLRLLGRWVPVGSGEAVAVAVSAAETGVLMAASFVGLGALGVAAARGAGRLWRRAREGSSAAPGDARGVLEGRSAAPGGARGAREGSSAAPESASVAFSGTPECAEALQGRLSGHSNLPPGPAGGRSGHPNLPSGPAGGRSGHSNLPSGPAGGRSGHPNLPSGLDPAAGSAPAAALPRRVFLERAAVGSALLAGGGSAGYGALFGRHDYELSTAMVPIPGLPKAADGFTIVQLSDIHLGQMVGEPEMRAAEELVRKAKGDLVVLTGDLVDHDARYTGQLGRLVRRLAAIRPLVAIPGNHDYYTGIDDVLSTVRAAGGVTLVNEAMHPLGERDGFALIGLDDPWGERRDAPPADPRGARPGAVGLGPDLGAALAAVRPDAPRIVLCHNPSVFLETAGQVALQIAGHTHGGQVNLGVRPADYVLPHGYVAGLYRTNGSHLYVNRGFGTAGPAVRVGAPPEVTRLVLVAA